MSNFNIYDRVLITDKSCNNYGRTGEIVNMISSPVGYFYAVNFDYIIGTMMWYRKDQLKHFDMPKPIEEKENEMNNKEFDNVNRPSHYCTGKYECIDVMIEVFGVEAVKNFCLCNSFKYNYRSGRKNGKEDLEKARWYINKYLELCNDSTDEKATDKLNGLKADTIIFDESLPKFDIGDFTYVSDKNDEHYKETGKVIGYGHTDMSNDIEYCVKFNDSSDKFYKQNQITFLPDEEEKVSKDENVSKPSEACTDDILDLGTSVRIKDGLLAYCNCIGHIIGVENNPTDGLVYVIEFEDDNTRKYTRDQFEVLIYG